MTDRAGVHLHDLFITLAIEDPLDLEFIIGARQMMLKYGLAASEDDILSFRFALVADREKAT